MPEITFFESVFEPKFCHWLLADARSSLSTTGRFSRSNYHWDPSIVRASQVVLVRDYEQGPAKLILGKLLERGVIEHANYSVMNYAWTRLSYIPWHNDPHIGKAITVFLNDKWNENWGGLFLYKLEKNGAIHAIAPQFNCAIRNGKNLHHATTLVGVDAEEPRFTIQLFSDKAPQD